jgi:lipid A 4'-phosphatase
VQMQTYTAVTSGRRSTKSFLFFSVSFVVWWALLLVFNRFPGLDLAVTRSFFTQTDCGVLRGVSKACGEFAYDKSPFFSSLRGWLFVLPYVGIAVLILNILISRLRNSRHWKSAQVKLSISALISLALGCGLLVNLFLKEFSGRPRPRETSLFGGDLDFVQAGSFAGKCIKNCSFVSGEASSAGWLFCLILLLPERWRISLGLPLVIVSALIPALRVITGAHYLSDALLGWLSSLVVFAGVLAIAENFAQHRVTE